MSPKLHLAGYGAFELKQAYQKNLGLGILFAGLIHITIIFGFLLYGYMTAKPAKPPIIEYYPVFPPPSITQTKIRPIPGPVPTVPKPTFGVPEPVPDEKAPTGETFATQKQLGEISSLDVKGLVEGTDDRIIVKIEQPEDILPRPEEFVPYDEPPVPLSEGEYKYPSLAREAGIEGTVWIKALVDKNGNVRDAFVFKPSGSNTEFEEVAKEAAFKIKYKPAISNNQPVAVWVVYPVCFRLK